MKPLIFPGLATAILLAASCSKQADQAQAAPASPAMEPKKRTEVVHPLPKISMGVSAQSQPQIQATPEMIKSVRLEPQQQALAQIHGTQKKERIEQLRMPKDPKVDTERGKPVKEPPARVESMESRRQARLQAMTLIRTQSPASSSAQQPEQNGGTQARPE